MLMLRPAGAHPFAMVRPAITQLSATAHQPQLTNRNSPTATHQPTKGKDVNF